MSYEIEKGVPIPEQALDRRRRSKYPWHDLEVEDSFVVPNTRKKTIVSAVNCANRRFKGERRFIYYTQSDGSIRVWRVS